MVTNLEPPTSAQRSAHCQLDRTCLSKRRRLGKPSLIYFRVAFPGLVCECPVPSRSLTSIMSIVAPAVDAFRLLLQPIAPFTWFGLPTSTLDIVAAFRLCLALRQIREDLHRKHVTVHGHTAVESRSFTRSALTALTVVYGGEVVTCVWL